MEKKGMYNIARQETYLDGRIIFKEGSSNNIVYIVLEGSVELYKSVEDRKFVIEQVKAGEVFGETGIMGDLKRPMTARAVGNTTVGIIELDLLKKEYGQLSKQFRSIVETLPTRLSKILERAKDFVE
jgi:CRP/FNR family cyclic AMP-dependent transcriptional regulator